MGKPRADYWQDWYLANKEKVKQATRANQKKRVAAGKCRFCCEPRLPTSNTFCRKHWFIDCARKNLGRGLVADGEFLEAMFEKQGGRCPYSGVELIPGDNCWLDHKYPRSLYPELARDPSNMEWVDKTVNKMKGNLTPDQFMELVLLIVKHSASSARFQTCGDSPLGGSVKQEPSVMNNE